MSESCPKLYAQNGSSQNEGYLYLFNQQQGNGLETIFGCVTTGEAWQFLKLEMPHLLIDSHRYYINEVEQILGVFQAILNFYETQPVIV